MDVEGAELQAASHHTLTLTSTSVTSASVSSSCVRGPGGGWSPGGGPPPDHGATGGHAELHTTVGTQLGVQGVSSSAGAVQCRGTVQGAGVGCRQTG